MWEFLALKTDKAPHISQKNVGYFQDSVQEIRLSEERGHAVRPVRLTEEKATRNVLWALLKKNGFPGKGPEHESAAFPHKTRVVLEHELTPSSG